MSKATEYRALAAEEHRLAGMCRSPYSREQHLLRETELLALARLEESLDAADLAQRAIGHGPANDREVARQIS